MISSDSLSALQALEKVKNTSSLLIQFQDMLHKIDVEEIVFVLS